MSYVGLDDQHESGRLTAMRERLSGEISIQTGHELPIYHDRTSSLWTRNWGDRVEGSDDPRTFLLAVITPRYFQDANCRSELDPFIQRERRLRRQDLIMPIYYVRCPLLEDETLLSRDPLARTIVNHQYTDWREFRFESMDSPEVGRALESLASQVSESLARSEGPSRSPLDVVSRVTGINLPRRLANLTGGRNPDPAIKLDSRSEPEPVVHADRAPREPEPEVFAPTRVVDPMGRHDHLTITEAIEMAKPGDRILVQPGIYEEELVMDKPLEIIGDGDLSEVIVRSRKGNSLIFKAIIGKVANLTFSQADVQDRFCVKIVQGKLLLEGCDVSSGNFSCVGICNGADPELKGNKIHGSNESGVIIYDHGRGVLEGNEITDNGLSGVEIKTGGDPS